jgi:hypothetical protein
VNNDARLQVRGGTGIFGGRVPFVFLSNFTNSGLIQNAVDLALTGTGAFGISDNRNRSSQIPATAALPRWKSAWLKDFKLPQVWRTNLAVDFRLPGDVIAVGRHLFEINGIYYATQPGG